MTKLKCRMADCEGGGRIRSFHESHAVVSLPIHECHWTLLDHSRS